MTTKEASEYSEWIEEAKEAAMFPIYQGYECEWEESFVGWDVLAGAVDVVRLVAVKNPHHGLYRLQVDAQAVVAVGVALYVLHVVLLVESAFNLLLADVDEAFALDIEAEAVHFRQDKLVGDEPDGVVGVFHSHDNAAARGVAPRGTGPEE